MNKKRIIQKSALLILCLVVFMPLVWGANIGISPAKIEFKNVLRGGYAEESVTITVDSTEETQINLDVRGEIAEWLNFSEMEFSVSKDSPYTLEIYTLPPEDIPNGNYSGFLRVTTSGTGNEVEGHATGIVQAAIDLYIQIEITDVEYNDCRASNFEVDSVEEGDPIIFRTKIKNDGNVRFSPNIKIKIWDQEQLEVLKEEEFYGEQILPTKEDEVVFQVDSDDLEVGQYWVEVYSTDCYSGETLTFDILEEGALKAKGILSKIVAPTWMNVGDTTSIKVLFENAGEKQIESRFKGTITIGGEIVQILESEKENVEMDESIDFNFYFTPKKPGKYILSGRVFYDGKRSYEKSVIINVEPRSALKTIGLFALYAGLIFVASFLMYKIKTERKKFSIGRGKR